MPRHPKTVQPMTSTTRAEELEEDGEGYEASLTVSPQEQSVLLQSCAPITHAEITEKVKEGGRLRGAVFLLTNWRKGYCVLHVHWPARPRLYRDLDRLLVLIRFEYGFTGTIALKRASDAPDGKRHWRVTL